MAASDPSHPNESAQEQVRRLRGVSLAGAGSTIADDELTTGRASKAKAILGATASAPGTSLLAGYENWKRSQAAAIPLAKAADSGAEVEAKALRKSRKRLRKHLLEGASPARASVLAHARYKAKGGRSGIDVWSRKVMEG